MGRKTKLHKVVGDAVELLVLFGLVILELEDQEAQGRAELAPVPSLVLPLVPQVQNVVLHGSCRPAK